MGTSFVQAYDSDFNSIWNLESNEQIVNMYRDSSYLIVINDSNVSLLDALTGEELESYSFEEGEFVHRRKRKEDFYDSLHKSLYFFTQKDSMTMLNKLVLDFKVSTSHLTSGIDIYPNPTLGKIWFKNVADNTELKVFDIRGKEILKSSIRDNAVDISSLPSGTYVLQIGETIQKIVKH